ncbi:hypothetical protein [Nocardia pneumoniae]|uniref:hypothetical protein n=1 Tax=Nocardia pneumoniae TaxID=228601 RepID=UPI0003148C0B|nr:hypothetical protein [Nocardia pneumoniae]
MPWTRPSRWGEAAATAGLSSLWFGQTFTHDAIALAGAARAADPAVIGDEELIAARVEEYFAAGATEVVFSQTDLTSPEDQRRTWRVLGELRRSHTR